MENTENIFLLEKQTLTLLEKLGTHIYLASLQARSNRSEKQEEVLIFAIPLRRTRLYEVIENNKKTKDKWNDLNKRFQKSQAALVISEFLRDQIDSIYFFIIAPTQHPHYTLHNYITPLKIKKTSIKDILNIILQVCVAVKEFVANRIACFNISPENVFVLGKENSSLLIQLSFFEIDHSTNLPDLHVNVLPFETYQYHTYINTNALTEKAKENEIEKYEGKQCIEQRAVWQLAALLDYFLRGSAYFNIDKGLDNMNAMMEKMSNYQQNLPERLKNEVCGNQLQTLLIDCLNINAGKRYPLQNFQNALYAILEPIVLQTDHDQKQITFHNPQKQQSGPQTPMIQEPHKAQQKQKQPNSLENQITKQFQELNIGTYYQQKFTQYSQVIESASQCSQNYQDILKFYDNVSNNKKSEIDEFLEQLKVTAEKKLDEHIERLEEIQREGQRMVDDPNISAEYHSKQLVKMVQQQKRQFRLQLEIALMGLQPPQKRSN